MNRKFLSGTGVVIEYEPKNMYGRIFSDDHKIISFYATELYSSDFRDCIDNLAGTRVKFSYVEKPNEKNIYATTVVREQDIPDRTIIEQISELLEDSKKYRKYKKFIEKIIKLEVHSENCEIDYGSCCCFIREAKEILKD